MKANKQALSPHKGDPIENPAFDPRSAVESIQGLLGADMRCIQVLDEKFFGIRNFRDSIAARARFGSVCAINAEPIVVQLASPSLSISESFRYLRESKFAKVFAKVFLGNLFQDVCRDFVPFSLCQDFRGKTFLF